ncbi:hypothetical protein [Rhodopseudomonas sp. BR0G17]|uniref:hypothetical protein n=1 Tax=Rhodopseudomonas sp. BR0G17 TaxID=2269368 RepID=UPI0013E0C7B1|nr:hypothetical protein [Rhodopseudomonas sp. BR0G17]NEW96614.1 hypothetical protein [Rhodopseudomonas sp. BR0G17]
MSLAITTASASDPRRLLSGHRAILALADDMRTAGVGVTETDMLRAGWTAEQLQRYGNAAANTARRLACRVN